MHDYSFHYYLCMHPTSVGNQSISLSLSHCNFVLFYENGLHIFICFILQVVFLGSTLEVDLHTQHLQACSTQTKMVDEHEHAISHLPRYRYCLENPGLGLERCCWTRPVKPTVWPQPWEAGEGPPGSSELIVPQLGPHEEGSNITSGLGNDLFILAEALIEAEEDRSIAVVRFDRAEAKRERFSRKHRSHYPMLPQPKENETLTEGLSSLRGLENATIHVRPESPQGITSSRPALPWGAMHRGQKISEHVFEFNNCTISRWDLAKLAQTRLAREQHDFTDEEVAGKLVGLHDLAQSDWVQNRLPIMTITRVMHLYVKPRMEFLDHRALGLEDTLVGHLRSGDVHRHGFNPEREKYIAAETADFFLDVCTRRLRVHVYALHLCMYVCTHIRFCMCLYMHACMRVYVQVLRCLNKYGCV